MSETSSMIQYRLQYDDEHKGAQQVGTEVAVAAAPRVEKKRKRKLRIPAAANTAITMIVCGGVFFAAVAYLPVGMRPQDFTGQYASDVTGAIKSREAEIQAELDTYNNQVKAAFDQRNAQMTQQMQGIIEFYKASFALNQTQMESANQLRGMYVQQSLSQAAQSNGANLGIATVAEMIGQGQNIFSPGSGDAALAEAERQRRIAHNRTTETAITSAAVDVSPYVNQLISPAELQAQLQNVQPVALPEPPRFVREDR